MPTKPEAPVRGYSFTDYQALNPEDPLPGTNVDIEFDRGFQTDAEFLAWLSVSIADDGKIKPEGVPDLIGPQGPQGIQGFPGAAGVPGVAGQQGQQGVPGPQGTQGPIGPQGLSYTPNAQGTKAGRTAYNSQAANFSYVATDTGEISWRQTATAGVWSAWFPFAKGDVGPQGPQGNVGPQGNQGVPGTAGTNGVNGAAGPQGPAGTAGAAGAAGLTGWSPLMTAENYGDKRLIRVNDYFGGQGTKPTSTGYLTTGGLTNNKDLATDFRQVALTVYNTQQFGPVTAGTTTFTIDGGYLPGTLRIFKQGLRQRQPQDVVATNGVTIIFGTAFAGGEYVIVEEMAPFEVANTLDKALNLSDVPDKAAARLNLGVPGAAGGGSTSVAGLVRLATDAEAAAMASNAIALSPANLLAVKASAVTTAYGTSGIMRFAIDAEAVGGDGYTQMAMTPRGVHRYAQAYYASWFDRTLYVSGAGPSGGKNGDIWMQIV